jgi:opacity protein-like surface antigen
MIAACLLLACALPALAQSSRLYFAGYLGLNVLHDQGFSESTTGSSGNIGFNNGPAFAGALGVRINNNVRVEGELSYRDQTITHINVGNASFQSGSDLKTWLLMMNAYYDFNFSWHNISPYVTAGIGFADHRGQINSGNTALAPNSSGHDFAFAYQAGTGLKYRMTPDLALTGGYRFLGTTDPSIGSYTTHYGAHEFRMGLEYDIPVGWMK